MRTLRALGAAALAFVVLMVGWIVVGAMAIANSGELPRTSSSSTAANGYAVLFFIAIAIATGAWTYRETGPR